MSVLETDWLFHSISLSLDKLLSPSGYAVYYNMMVTQKHEMDGVIRTVGRFELFWTSLNISNIHAELHDANPGNPSSIHQRSEKAYNIFGCNFLSQESFSSEFTGNHEYCLINRVYIRACFISSECG